MKNRGGILKISLFILFIGALFFFMFTWQNGRYHLNFKSPLATSTPDIVWSTYVNTKYNYALSYPSNGSVLKINEEEPVNETESLEIVINGEHYAVTVKAEPLKLPSYAHANTEYAAVIPSNPKTIAEYGLNAERTYLAKHPTPYNRTLHPSELRTTTIGGTQAYGFSINGSSEAWPLGGFEGPALNVTNNYFVFQNNAGDKFIVAYPAADPISQKIIDSFRFTGSSTTTAP